MAKVTKKDEVALLIEELQNSGWQQEEFKDGTFYVEDKNEYSFHIYFVYNNTKSPTFDEITYNLKDRQYSILRNMKEVNFSEDNLVRSFGRIPASRLSFLEVDGNAGFYQDCFDLVSKRHAEREKMVSRFLVRLIEEYPVLERLHKAGFNISKTFYDIRDYKTNSLLEAFGFATKYHLRMYREFNNYPELTKRKYYDELLTCDAIRKASVEDLQFLQDMYNYCVTLDKKYGLEKTVEVLDMMVSRYDTIANSAFNKLGEKIKEALGTNKKLDVKRIVEYCAYEVDVRQGITSFRQAINLYSDYVSMAARLGNKYERYPKSLKMRHDIASKFTSILGDENTCKEFKGQVEKITHLEGAISGTDWAMVVPRTPEDVVDEGEQLSHCVKSYIQSIAKGDCSIIFLRKSEDLATAVYTVELRDNAVVQFAGEGNCEPDDDAKEALHKWAEGFNLIEDYA